jgi:hypothetical protein
VPVGFFKAFGARERGGKSLKYPILIGDRALLMRD